MDGLTEWEEAGPSNIVEDMNKHEDRGKGNQGKPERKIVKSKMSEYNGRIEAR